MHLMLSRNQHRCEGHSLFLCEGDKSVLLCIINGNKPDTTCPIFLNEVDPYTVFGLSQPLVISQILEAEPRVLLSSKEIGHRTFEHGMKASWGKIKIKNSYMFTNMETFYKISEQADYLNCRLEAVSYAGGIALYINCNNSYTVFYTAAKPNKILETSKFVCIDNIKNYMLIDC